MEIVIAQLNQLIFEEASDGRIEALENVLAEGIEDAIKLESFFQLPIQNIINIVRISETNDVVVLRTIVAGINEAKGTDGIQILSTIDSDEGNLDELIDIVLKFRSCPILNRIHEIRERDRNLPFRDERYDKYEQKINLLQKALDSPGEIKDEVFNSIRNDNFEILKFLIEKCHATNKLRNDAGSTPFIFASFHGRLEIVKYIKENCQVNVESRTNDGSTALILASQEGHIDVVRYLVNECHANVEASKKILATTNIYMDAILTVSYKLMFGKDVFIRQVTALMLASLGGHLDVVRYLVEECGAKIFKTRFIHIENQEVLDYINNHA